MRLPNTQVLVQTGTKAAFLAQGNPIDLQMLLFLNTNGVTEITAVEIKLIIKDYRAEVQFWKM